MLDKKTQDTLRERFNPEGSPLRELQLRMLTMLDYFDKICRENDIQYWISSGTALGAVRHGGYIPWDDDIDVSMLRQDYNKLQKVIKRTKDFPYNLQNMASDPYYLYGFAKLRDKKTKVTEQWIDEKYKFKGVFIDIFIVEKNNHFLSKSFNWILTYVLCPLTKSDNYFVTALFHLLKRIYMFFIWFFRGISFCFIDKEYRYAYGSTFTQTSFEYNSTFPLSEIEFEGKMYLAPRDVDFYLWKLYGNYQRLPDYDKIQVHFNDFEIFE